MFLETCSVFVAGSGWTVGHGVCLATNDWDFPCWGRSHRLVPGMGFPLLVFPLLPSPLPFPLLGFGWTGAWRGTLVNSHLRGLWISLPASSTGDSGLIQWGTCRCMRVDSALGSLQFVTCLVNRGVSIEHFPICITPLRRGGGCEHLKMRGHSFKDRDGQASAE